MSVLSEFYKVRALQIQERFGFVLGFRVLGFLDWGLSSLSGFDITSSLGCVSVA